MRVGFIGLGIMGRGMAANLLRSGYDVVVYNRTQSRCGGLAAAGAAVAATAAEVAEAADIIGLCVTDGAAVSAVVDQLRPVLRPGQLVCDHSTIAPEQARQAADTVAQAGAEMLDAPVTGGDQGARDGTLTIMVGGSEGGYAQALPYLQAIGKTILHVGPSGQGQVVKLVNNWIGGVALVAAAEGLAFGLRAGVDLDTMMGVLTAGSADSVSLRLLAERLRQQRWEPGFSLRNRIKDMVLCQQAAAELGLALPVGDAALERFHERLNRGEGDEDQSVVARAYR